MVVMHHIQSIPALDTMKILTNQLLMVFGVCLYFLLQAMESQQIMMKDNIYIKSMFETNDLTTRKECKGM